MKFKSKSKLAIIFIGILIGILGISCSFTTFADFAVKEDDIYDPCYRFPVKENYGNGQTCKFRRATLGGYILTQDEEAALARYLPICEYNRFYGRLAVGSSSYTMSSLQNRATSVQDRNGTIVTKSVTKSSPVVEIAVGYVWSDTFRAEVEYLANRNFTYAANPVLTGPGVPPRSFTSVIQVNPFLLNFYYDFKWFERFRPYVVGGVGFSVNSITSTVSPNADLIADGGTPTSGKTTARLGSFVYGVGAGFRVRVFSHWYIDAKIRYINMGLMKMRAMSNFEIEGILSQVPATLGVLYLF